MGTGLLKVQVMPSFVIEDAVPGGGDAVTVTLACADVEPSAALVAVTV